MDRAGVFRYGRHDRTLVQGLPLSCGRHSSKQNPVDDRADVGNKQQHPIVAQLFNGMLVSHFDIHIDEIEAVLFAIYSCAVCVCESVWIH